MNCFSFDIETIPDVEFGRRMWDLADLSDEDVASAMIFRQLQATGSEFLPLHQHRIVAIAVALRSGEDFRVWSLGNEESDEAELLRRFFDGVDRYTPDLISWNGGGFDLPVLNYRALKHSIQAPRYWEKGDSDREFRYNNYLSRFHWRHLDLMDVLSGFQIGARSSLQQVATLLGFPGKLGMSGDQVWDRYQVGELSAIRDYCETDALNTYLIYLRFQLVRGILDETRYNAELEQLRAKLEQAESPHFDKFLAAWRSGRDAE